MNDTESPDNIKKALSFSHKCSHCGQVDRLELSIELLTEKPLDPYDDWLASLTPEVRRTVDEMDRNGLLRAYRQTASEVMGHIPRNPAKALLNYFRAATKLNLTSAAQLVLTQQFGKNRKIEVLQHTNIAALFVDDALAMFGPRNLFDVHALQNGGASRLVAVGDMAKAADSLSQWMRTKMGYVPREAAIFFAEMRRRSVGEFARAASGTPPQAKAKGASS